MTAAEAGRLPGLPSRNTVLRRMGSGLPVESPAVKLYRRSIWITHNGETLPLPEWARRAGLSRWMLHQRIKAGWPPELALNPERRQGRQPSSAVTPPATQMPT